MIRAMIFDLDGTLVQTERLKAFSAVTTPFTRQRIHAEQELDERWIVDDPTTLTAVVQQMVAALLRHRRNENRTKEQTR